MTPRAIAIAGLALAGLAGCVEAPQETGAELYAARCASCHGADATGNPDIGAPDLTTLAARHGGTFPAGYVMSTIDGYSRDATHGPMPAFGALIASPVETWTDADGTPTPTPRALILLAQYLEGRQAG